VVPSEELSREALVAFVTAQAGVIDELRAALAGRDRRNDELAAEVDKLKRQLSRNSRNSSLSPSSDGVIPGREAPKPAEKDGSGPKRGRGRQPGTDGMTLAWADDPDRVEAYYPTGDCACGAGLDGAEVVGVARSRQSHDLLPIRAAVVQHDLYRVRCGCGRRHVADQPAGVAAGPVSYGENLRAFALYLLVRQHIPVERVAELIGEFTGVTVSTGWVHGLLTEAAAAAAPALAAIEDQIVAADVVGFDETPLKVGAKGEKATVLSASTERHVVFMLARRGKASFQVFLLSRVAGIVVHDRYALYDHPELKVLVHALCAAHILRDIEDVIETYPDALWPPQLRRALTGLIHQANLARADGRTAIPDDVLRRLVGEFRSAVRAGLSEIPPAGKGRKQPVGRCLLECLRDRQHDVLRFAHDLRVWATNNQSERDLRPFKTQQKISGRLTSITATRARLAVHSYLPTARKHGLNALHVLGLAFRGTAWMPPGVAVPT
jgi:hypothetical protein